MRNIVLATLFVQLTICTTNAQCHGKKAEYIFLTINGIDNASDPSIKMWVNHESINFNFNGQYYKSDRLIKPISSDRLSIVPDSSFYTFAKTDEPFDLRDLQGNGNCIIYGKFFAKEKIQIKFNTNTGAFIKSEVAGKEIGTDDCLLMRVGKNSKAMFYCDKKKILKFDYLLVAADIKKLGEINLDRADIIERIAKYLRAGSGMDGIINEALSQSAGIQILVTRSCK